MLLRLAILILVLCISAAARPDEASGVIHSVDKGDIFNVDGFGKVDLSGIRIFLNIDDGTGRYSGGTADCMVYLSTPDGMSDLNRNFNHMVIDSVHGSVRNNSESEFRLSNGSKD